MWPEKLKIELIGHKVLSSQQRACWLVSSYSSQKKKGLVCSTPTLISYSSAYSYSRPRKKILLCINPFPNQSTWTLSKHQFFLLHTWHRQTKLVRPTTQSPGTPALSTPAAPRTQRTACNLNESRPCMRIRQLHEGSRFNKDINVYFLEKQQREYNHPCTCLIKVSCPGNNLLPLLLYIFDYYS